MIGLWFFLLAQAQVQNAVCLSENRCIGTDLGVMSTQDCCVQNPNGASFRIPGQELCTECTGKYANCNNKLIKLYK